MNVVDVINKIGCEDHACMRQLKRVGLCFPKKCRGNFVAIACKWCDLYKIKWKIFFPKISPATDHGREKRSVSISRSHIAFTLIPDDSCNFKICQWIDHTIECAARIDRPSV